MSKETKSVFKFNLSIEQDENYINQMAEKGWKLVRIFLGVVFHFEKCEPDEYICRAMFVKSKERDDICEILVDSGAEIIHDANPEGNMHIYAIRKKELGEFTLNNTIDSKVAEYKNKVKYYLYFGIIFFIIGIIFVHDYDESFIFVCGIIEIVVSTLLLITGIPYILKLKELKKERETNE